MLDAWRQRFLISADAFLLGKVNDGSATRPKTSKSERLPMMLALPALELISGEDTKRGGRMSFEVTKIFTR